MLYKHYLWEMFYVNICTSLTLINLNEDEFKLLILERDYEDGSTYIHIRYAK